MTSAIASVALSITLLGFKTFGVEQGTAWAALLYEVIFIMLIVVPFGFHLSSGASGEDLDLAIGFRIVVNIYCFNSGISVLYTWFELQIKDDLMGKQSAAGMMGEMTEKVLLAKIIIIMISNCVIFNFFRFLTLWTKLMLSRLAV